MQVRIHSVAYPTEDMQRVSRAIESILGRIQLSHADDGEVVRLDGTLNQSGLLGGLRQAIHDRRIIDAVRSRLQRNRVENTSRLMFDKQAALQGRVRLLDDSIETPPLGSILLEFRAESETEFNSFMNWFVPPTEDGRVVMN